MADNNVTAGGNMQTDSATSEEDGLGAGVFPNHPRSGFWFSSKGEAMEAWEMKPLESDAAGETRHQTPSNITQKWDSTILESGEFDPTNTTKGVGTEAGPTDIPNHKSEG